MNDAFQKSHLGLTRCLWTLTIFMLASISSYAQPCLSNFRYRVPVLIDNSTNAQALTDYETRVVLNTQALITAGKLQSTGADFRFTDAAGNLLNYYVETENLSAATNAVIWVQTPSIGANSSTTIYMFYGNATVNSLSNGEQTFVLFDDFEDGVVDNAKWTSTGNVVELGGRLRLASSGGGSLGKVESASSYGFPVIAETFISSVNAGLSNIGLVTNAGNGYALTYEIISSVPRFFLTQTTSSGSVLNTVSAPNNATVSGAQPTGKWSFTWPLPGVQNFSTPLNSNVSRTANNLTHSFPQTLFLSQTAFAGVTLVDRVWLRKHTSNEPTANIGAETELASNLQATSSGTICEGQNLLLGASSFVGAAYSWSGPDGFTSNQQNPVIANATPVKSGTYSVTVSGAAGCASSVATTSASILPTPTPGSLSGAATVCGNSNTGTITLSGNNSAVIRWESAQNSNGPWMQLTNTTASLTYTNLTTTTFFRAITGNTACGEVATTPIAITVDEQTNGGILTGAASVCPSTNSGVLSLTNYVGNILDWEASTDGVNFNSLGHTNQTYSYNNLTTTTYYRVRVQSGSCPAQYSTTAQITVEPQPVISFSTSGNCQSEQTNFSFTGSIASGSISNYSWDFGDGTTGVGQTTSHRYNTAANFNVSLTATTDKGCISTASQNVAINPTVQLSFVSDSVCLGEAITFTNTSTLSSGSANYAWNFGDGNLSSAITPTHTFGNSGTYTVNVIATTDQNCTSKLAKTVQIFPRAQPAFSFQNQCLGTPVNFSNNTTLSSGGLTYNWDFDDGTFSTEINPSKAFGTPNSYAVKLVATTNQGCTDSLTNTVEIFSLPEANFTAPANSCLGDTASFSNLSTGTVPLHYLWLFGNGDSAVTENAQKEFVNSGEYNVRLELTDANSCTASMQRKITIRPNPTADFTIQGNCEDSAVVFENRSNVSQGILNYTWRFGDGNMSAATNPSHTYATAGNYPVTLIATSDFSCQDSVTIFHELLEAPAFSQFVGADTVCEGINSGILELQGRVGQLTWLQASSASGPFVPLSETTDTLVFENLSASTWYKAQLNNGSCASLETPVQKITVDRSSLAGSLSGDLSLCENPSDSLFLNGQRGAVSTWLISNNQSGPFTALLNPNTFLDLSTYTQSTAFKVVVTNGVCDADTSEAVFVSIAPQTVAGNLMGADTVCAANANAVLDLQGAIGNIIRWESTSANTGLWSTIPEDTIQLVLNGLTESRQYRAVVKSGACEEEISNAVRVQVDPLTRSGIITGASEHCEGDNTGQLSLVNAVGSIVNWQSSTDKFNWVSLGHTGNQLNYSNLDTTHYYRVEVKSGVCQSVISDSVQVKINPLPLVNFSTDTICEGDFTSFQNTSIQPLGSLSQANFSWNFGDGNTSTSRNPQHQYADGGQYQASLRVTSLKGCTDSSTAVVQVNQKPNVDFLTSDVCFPQTSGFTSVASVFGLPSIQSRSWRINGQNYNGNQVNVQLPQANDYSISHTVVSSQGCVDSIVKIHSVLPKPQAQFLSDTLCFGETAQFPNNSGISEGNLSYSWNFGDGSGSNLINPTHAYADTGNFAVELIAESTKGCSDTVVQNFRVNEAPQALFSAANECLADSVRFLNQSISTSAMSYTWSFDDGNTSILANPVHLFQTPGDRSIRLRVTNTFGCLDSTVQIVSVYPQPVAAFEISTHCENAEIPLQNNSSISTGVLSYSWIMGDGTVLASTEPKYSYADSGKYMVQLTATSAFGCSDSISKSVQVDKQSDAGIIAGNDTVCASANSGLVQLSNFIGKVLFWETQQAGATSLSTLNNTKARLDYQNLATTSSFRAVVENGTCQADTSDFVTIKVDEVSDAGTLANTLRICEDTNQVMLQTSQIIGSAIAWIFNPEQGSSSLTGIGQNMLTLTPPYNAGNYALRIKNGVCAEDTSNFLSLFVDSLTQAGILLGEDTFCNPGPQHVLNISSFRGSPLYWETRSDTSLQWVQVGAGSDSLLVSGLKETQYYRAVVKNGVCKPQTTAQIKVQIDEPSSAGNIIGASSICEGVNQGTLSVQNINGSILRWQLSSDGIQWRDTVLFSSSLPYLNLDSSRYHRVIVQNGVCDADTSGSALLHVNFRPRVAYVVDTVCEGTNSSFINSSVVPQGTVQQWFWDFGDGSGSSIQNPIHIYNTSSVFNTQLKVLSSDGCLDSASVSVLVNPQPVANYQAPNVCATDSSQFTNLSSVSTSTISSYFWDFGDNIGTDTIQNPSYAWNNAGLFNVKLRVATTAGCLDSTIQQIQVYPNPVSIWNADTVFEGNNTSFFNNSTILSGNLLHLWNFGDGTSSQAISPQKSYSSFGTYTVTHVASTVNGCSDTTQTDVRVKEQPEANFSVAYVCIHDSAFFTNSSIYTSGSANYLWDFGDGTTDTASNPVHKYVQPGTYTVSLQLTADNGGTDQISKSIIIYPKPVVSFTKEDVCDSVPVLFKNLSTISNGSIQHFWNFGDGTTSTSFDPIHTYPTFGTYIPKLIVTSDFGCVDSLSKPIQIYERPQADFFVNDVCHGEVSFFDDSTVYLTNKLLEYSWDFGDGTNSIVRNPTKLYLNPGDYTISLLVVSDDNCRSEITKSTEVFETPKAMFSAQNECFGDAIVFENNTLSNLPALAYTWNFGDATNSSVTSPSKLYDSAGVYNVQLKVQTPQGCMDSIQSTVESYALPVISAISEFNEVSKGFPTQLLASGALFYEWEPSNSLDRDNGNNPVARPLENTTYTITGLDSNGCENDTTLLVRVIEDYKLIATNLLTPDANGQNDFWFIENIETYGNCNVVIYNRWGDIVYESTGYTNDWDGTNQAGEPLPDGAYYYVVSFDSSNTVYKGAVTVLRNN